MRQVPGQMGPVIVPGRLYQYAKSLLTPRIYFDGLTTQAKQNAAEGKVAVQAALNAETNPQLQKARPHADRSD